MMLLESQGYDYWFEKVAHPTYMSEKGAAGKSNIGLLEKLKSFIEVDMSKESKAVLFLKPNQLRLLTKMHPQTLMNEVSKEQEKSINYYDDSLLNTTYPELYDKLSLADVRYLWALLRSFNRYLAPSGSFGSHNAPVV